MICGCFPTFHCVCVFGVIYSGVEGAEWKWGGGDALIPLCPLWAQGTERYRVRIGPISLPATSKAMRNDSMLAGDTGINSGLSDLAACIYTRQHYCPLTREFRFLRLLKN